MIIFSAIHIKNFRIDASSDTLVSQNDKDYLFFNNYQKIFPTKNNLIIAIKTNDKIDNKLLGEIDNLTNKLLKLKPRDYIGLAKKLALKKI